MNVSYLFVNSTKLLNWITAMLFLDKELYKLENYLAEGCVCESHWVKIDFLHQQLLTHTLR
jgi:hypothetical protein